MNKTLLLITILMCLFGCKPSKIRTLNKNINVVMNDKFYENQFTGLFIYEPDTQDTLYQYNSSKYFTPASNTKIFTLYGTLKTLSDSIPALKYYTSRDTLYIEGTGDPSFLHPYFEDRTVLDFVSKYDNVGLYLKNFQDTHFAPGWAWEDYDTYFSPERSGFPMYGNVVEISKANTLEVVPKYFEDAVTVDRNKSIRRAYNSNTFYYTRQKDTVQIPMVINDTLIKNLWDFIAPNKVTIINKMPAVTKKILYSIPSDSLYKRMMLESDNFLAEQMLMLVSSTLSDTINSSKARGYILNTYLSDIAHKPRWVDGSGLSRYNLFTPESFGHVLSKMYVDISKQRLFNLFVTYKMSGSSKPYMFAKSGSIGNNYNFSGYLITKSGKVLVFSFMNNHFTKRSSEIKRQLETLLREIYNTY